MRKTLLALLGLLVLAGQSNAVRAQDAATAALSLVDAQGFPTMAALLDVFDGQGQPITGLQPADVTILEDGQPFPVDRTERVCAPGPDRGRDQPRTLRLLSAMERGSTASAASRKCWQAGRARNPPTTPTT